MGNAACSSQKPKKQVVKKKEQTNEDQNTSRPAVQNETQKQNWDLNQLSAPLQSVVNKNRSEITPQQNQTPYSKDNHCINHQQESYRAICVTIPCAHKERILCAECLIDHQCQKKLRLLDFVNRLRSNLSKDALDVFMELFDDNNLTKQETEKVMIQMEEQIKKKIMEIAEKQIGDLIVHFYHSQSDLKDLKVNAKIIQELELILEGNKSTNFNFKGRTAECRPETLELGLKLILTNGMVEKVCNQIEKCKSDIVYIAKEFQQSFQQILIKYMNSLKFLFDILITPLEFIWEDEYKQQIKKKKGAGSHQNYLQPSKRNENEVKKDSSKIKVKDHQQVQQQQKSEMIQQQQKEEKVNRICQKHQQEIIAICVNEVCTHGSRKMCADCLIENSQCQQRMKLNEFNGRLKRVINKEVIDELILPYQDSDISNGLKKVMNEVIHELIEKDLKQMYVKYHLIQSAVPKGLDIQLSKQFFMDFTNMLQEGKVLPGNKSIELGVFFINNQSFIEQFLGAIVKTEQQIPQQIDKLQHKLIGITTLFTENLSLLIEVFKNNVTSLPTIQSILSHFINEPFLLEESIYKIKNDGSVLGEWNIQNEFQVISNASITDISPINEQNVAFSCSDGSIIIWNISKKKHLATLKHGAFSSSLTSFKHQAQSIIISSGFSIDTGHSLATWDLTSKKPNHLLSFAHSDSIRKIKHLYVNSSLTQHFHSRADQQSTINQSEVVSKHSQQISGSQSSITYTQDGSKQEESLLTCSDDGTIKLWKIVQDLKIQEDQLLRQKGPCVLDFTILNGCILVAALTDKTIQIVFSQIYQSIYQSLPFHNSQPFQSLHDDSPVYAITAIDQVQSKFKSSKTKIPQSVQQRFITGNERGNATIYTWQNGRAVVQRILQLHTDKITKLLMYEKLQPGYVASISSDKNICLTLLSQAKILSKLNNHSDPLTGIIFMKELSYLISSDQNGRVIVWQ